LITFLSFSIVDFFTMKWKCWVKWQSSWSLYSSFKMDKVLVLTTSHLIGVVVTTLTALKLYFWPFFFKIVIYFLSVLSFCLMTKGGVRAVINLWDAKLKPNSKFLFFCVIIYIQYDFEENINWNLNFWYMVRIKENCTFLS
jgi:hypothetical protein